MRRILAILGSALALASCATAQRLDAANDVHALLTSIRDDDARTFEAHIDRPALQREIEARMARELGRAKADDSLKLLGALLAPTVARVAGDALIQPSTFRMVAANYGYTPSQRLPGPIAIASVLKPLEDGRVCATRKKDGPCVLIFTKEGQAWRLSGFEGDLAELRKRG